MVSPLASPAVETVMVSSPAPAFMMSFPPLPSIVSSPLPPFIVSLFPFPLRVSLPDNNVKL